MAYSGSKIEGQINNLNVKMVGGYVRLPTQFVLLNKLNETDQNWKCYI